MDNYQDISRYSNRYSKFIYIYNIISRENMGKAWKNHRFSMSEYISVCPKVSQGNVWGLDANP